MPLRVPQADAVSWLRAGALGLGCVLLGVVAVSMLLSPAPAPAGDLAADSSVLSDRRDLHREAAVGSLGGDGRASTTKSRDRDIAMLVLNDHAAFRRWFALMDEAQAQADAEEEAETKKAAEGAANEEEEQKKGSEKNEKKKTNNGLAKLESIWNALTLHLEIHAQAEEKLLYPTLVRKGGEEAGAETKDAIGTFRASFPQALHATAFDAIIACAAFGLIVDSCCFFVLCLLCSCSLITRRPQQDPRRDRRVTQPLGR
jgi:hypothetical protein